MGNANTFAEFRKFYIIITPSAKNTARLLALREDSGRDIVSIISIYSARNGAIVQSRYYTMS